MGVPSGKTEKRVVFHDHIWLMRRKCHPKRPELVCCRIAPGVRYDQGRTTNGTPRNGHRTAWRRHCDCGRSTRTGTSARGLYQCRAGRRKERFTDVPAPDRRREPEGIVPTSLRDSQRHGLDCAESCRVNRIPAGVGSVMWPWVERSPTSPERPGRVPSHTRHHVMHQEAGRPRMSRMYCSCVPPPSRRTTWTGIGPIEPVVGRPFPGRGHGCC